MSSGDRELINKSAAVAANDTSAPAEADKPFDLAAIVTQLRGARERWRTAQKRPLEVGGRELPSRETLADVIDGLRGALFPMRLGPPDLRQENEDDYIGHTLDAVLGALLVQVRLELGHHARHDVPLFRPRAAREAAPVQRACARLLRRASSRTWLERRDSRIRRHHPQMR
jgi:hypothetical protein